MIKKIENFLKNACTYTVIMLAVLYVFSLIMQLEDNGINPGKFALLLLFGVILAASEFIFKINTLHKAWRIVMHYCILMFSFTLIFTRSGMLGKSSDIFTSFFVFTFLYFTVYGVVLLVRLCIRKAKKARSVSTVSTPEKKTAYKPRFNDTDEQ